MSKLNPKVSVKEQKLVLTSLTLSLNEFLVGYADLLGILKNRSHKKQYYTRALVSFHINSLVYYLYSYFQAGGDGQVRKGLRKLGLIKLLEPIDNALNESAGEITLYQFLDKYRNDMLTHGAYLIENAVEFVKLTNSDTDNNLYEHFRSLVSLIEKLNQDLKNLLNDLKKE